MSTTPQASVSRLLQVLRDVSRSIERQDAVAAADAMAAAVNCCADVDLAGPMPSAAEFRELVAAYERCVIGAGPLRAKLQTALREMMASRRAASTYQRVATP